MAAAATLTQPWMLELYDSLPQYFGYHRRTRANHDEAEFRLALGQRLQELGQRLFDGADLRPHLLARKQHELVEMMTEDITTVMKLLNRTGVISISGDPGESILELQTIDGELLILLERMWALADAMYLNECVDFMPAAQNLTICLEAFLRLAEERNSLLGLGWESEFGRAPTMNVVVETEKDS